MYSVKLHQILLLLFIGICIFSCQNKTNKKSGKNNLEADLVPVPTSDKFKYIGEAINEPGYDVWGSSPIRDNNGNIHLFSARWLGNIAFTTAWRYNSEIAHYVGEKPEGPFKSVRL